MERQLAFEKKIGRSAYALVSYDRLVDEQMEGGEQIKKRVTGDTAEQYVTETIEAAEYLSSRRERLPGRRLVLSCQGSTAEQYLDCLKEVLQIARPGDIVGLGGFCILSKSKTYENQFYEVIREGFPCIKRAGVDRVHIFGMGVFRALVQADIWARMNGLECSYDTSAAEMNAVFGKSFDPVQGQMRQIFSKSHKNKGYRSADLALLNIRLIDNYWSELAKMPLPEEFSPGTINKNC